MRTRFRIRYWVLILAASVALPFLDAAAQLPEPSGQIAFTTRVAPNLFQIMSVDVRTSKLRHLGNPFAGADIVRWSPDGRRIAFHGFANGRWRLFTMDSDGTNVNEISPESGGGNPEWSPDGQRIAFVANAALFVMGANGANPRQLIGWPNFPGLMSQIGMDWSPDGKWLAFGSGFEVWIVGANGENPRQLTQIRQHFQGLTWSPDSELIAFPFDGGSPRLDIYAMSPLGGPTQRIAETRDLNETHPSWSPDGRHIAVSGQKGGGHGISILNVESGEVQTLVETPEWAQSLDWCDPTRRLSVTSAAKQPEAWGRLKQWIATGSQ